jgi:hypothetical protein
MTHGLTPTRREVLAGAAAAAATLGAPNLLKADAPAQPVAVVRCRNYNDDLTGKMSTLFDQIGGIDKLVKGKTVALKLILTG